MNSFIDAAINRTRTTMLLMLMVVLTGLISYNSIPIENDPHIEVPFFVVGIIHEGISPEDSERLLVMPMELELRKVEGLKELTAYASEGSATLLVEFDADYDLDQALLDVREAVDRAKVELPSTAEEPFVREESTDDFPIIQVNLVGDDVPERMLYNLAIDMRDDIEAIPDVLEAELRGEREEMLEAVIDPNALEAYQISNEELITTIVRNNRLIPAGSIDTGSGRFATVAFARIFTMGAGLGLYGMAISQRASSIHNDILKNCGFLLLGHQDLGDLKYLRDNGIIPYDSLEKIKFKGKFDMFIRENMRAKLKKVKV